MAELLFLDDFATRTLGENLQGVAPAPYQSITLEGDIAPLAVGLESTSPSRMAVSSGGTTVYTAHTLYIARSAPNFVDSRILLRFINPYHYSSGTPTAGPSSLGYDNDPLIVVRYKDANNYIYLHPQRYNKVFKLIERVNGSNIEQSFGDITKPGFTHLVSEYRPTIFETLDPLVWEVTVQGTKLVSTIRTETGTTLHTFTATLTRSSSGKPGFGARRHTSGVAAWSSLRMEDAFGIEALEINSADDISQPFNDFDMRASLSFMDKLNTYVPATATDALGQVIARGTPVNPPSLSENRASYGIRSILGRMAKTPINKTIGIVLENPNNTAKQAIEATLTALQGEHAWLEWEPIPDLDLETSVGTVTPRIDVVYHKPEAKASDRKTVLGLLQEMLEPFVLAGYEFAPSANNKFEIKPPSRKQNTANAIPLDWDKISGGGVTEIEPRFEPSTVAILNYKPWGYQAGLDVIEPSSIRIMPSYWHAQAVFSQQASWLTSPLPTVGTWNPTLDDSQGSPITHKEVYLEGVLLFEPGGFFNVRDAWLADTNTRVDIPLIEGGFVKPGTSITVDLTLKRWSLMRSFTGPPGAMSDLTHTATLPADGAEHLLKDFGGYWFSGPFDTDKPVGYKVYGTYDKGVKLRIETSLYQRPSALRSPNLSWDFGTVLRVEATGEVYAQNDNEIEVIYGDPDRVSSTELSQQYAAIPWLQQAQADYGYSAISLTIEKYTLRVDGDSDGVLLELLESILRERSRPRKRWNVPLGIVAEGITPYEVNKLVAVPFTGDGYGLLTAVSTSKGTRGGRYSSDTTVTVEELPTTFQPLYYDGASVAMDGSNAAEV